MGRTIVFLFGSGASFGANMPNVRTLTERILSGDGVVRHTDGCYYIFRPRNYSEAHEAVERNVAFLGELKTIANHYFAVHWPGRQADYEDLADLCHEIDDAIGGGGYVNFEDPGLSPLIEQLADHAGCDNEQLNKTAVEGWHYVNDVVRALLSLEIGDTNYLAAITDACTGKCFDRITLATLNHDLVLDRALENAGVNFSGGFTHQHGDVLVWADDFGDVRVRLLKLHGSVNWYARRLPGEEWRERVTIAPTGDVEHAKGPKGEDLGFTADGRPEFLAGTFTKILNYDRRIYPEQHYRFQEALRETDRIVVVGYGFRDKAINSRLIGWLDRSLDNKLIVVEPNPGHIQTSARGAIRSAWRPWQRDGRMRLIAAKIEDVKSSLLLEAIVGT